MVADRYDGLAKLLANCVNADEQHLSTIAHTLRTIALVERGHCEKICIDLSQSKDGTLSIAADKIRNRWMLDV